MRSLITPLLLLLCCAAHGDAAALCTYDCRDDRGCSASCLDDAGAALQASSLPHLGACVRARAASRRAPRCASRHARANSSHAQTEEGELARRCLLAAASCDSCPAPLPRPVLRRRLADEAPDANLTHWQHDSERAERHSSRRYDGLRVWVLTAFWDVQRTLNAHAVCAAMRPGRCRVVAGIHAAAELNETGLLALEAEGIVTRKHLPPRPQWYRRVPDQLLPLLPEYATNQMAASHRTGPITAIAAGNARVLKQMAAAAEAAGPAAAARTLYVYLEDDADLGAEPALFEAKLLELADKLPWRWDVVSLAPVPRVCSRSAMLPWYSRRSALVRPRVAFSRTTALVHSARGVQRLLAALPVNNAVDLWYRALMRQGKLVIMLHCGGLVRIGASADKQAHR